MIRVASRAAFLLVAQLAFSASSLAQRAESWKVFPHDVLTEQKQIWLFPKSLVRSRHWLPAAGVVLATAGLVALDPHDAPTFRRAGNFQSFNQTFSSSHTIIGMALVPLAAYGWAARHRDAGMHQTVQLTAESVLNAELVALVMRDVARRVPPRSIAPQGDFSASWFRSQKGLFNLDPGGFPSGHTVAAFSIATVFATRYRRRRWVPWLAYGLAGLVGFSRISLQAHFPSDVFAGAVLGYAVSRYGLLPGR